MDKMIEIVNHNLEAIMTGVKAHKEKAENTLGVIEKEIKAKTKILNKFNSQVDNNKDKIELYEQEIASLENDLKELNDKFSSNDFKEIISVGNKEINGKISEKKNAINECNSKIIELDKKIEQINSLIEELENKKEIVNKNLEDSIVIETYYCKKIGEIITFTTEHPEELAVINEEPEEEKVDLSEIDKDELLKAVDDSVFKEIDDYTNIMDKASDIEQQAKEFEEKAKELSEQIIDYDITDEEDEDNEENENQEIEENSIEIDEKKIEEVFNIDEEEPKGYDENYIINQDNIINLFIDDEGLEEKDNPEGLYSFSMKDLENIDSSSQEEQVQTDEEEEYVIDPNHNSVFKEITDMVFDKKELLDNIPTNEIDLSEIQYAFMANETPLNVSLDECGLDIDLFSEESRIKLEINFNKENTIEFLNIMKKHNINTNVIYDSVDVLKEVSPQILDETLTLLEKTKVKPSTIEYIFKYLNKVNVFKLESVIEENKDKQLTEILYECVVMDNKEIIGDILELSNDEVKKLKKSASLEEYDIMNMFPEIIVANYNTLKALKIDNLNECITKHPHRFIYNPDSFNEILDKYDLEDLVRCINKNSAVIDKL